MSWRGNADEVGTVTAGCLFSMGSALLTCFLLFINGALVMAVVRALAQSGPSWLGHAEFSQFLLLSIPVLLVIIEWLMFDYLRSRLGQRRTPR